MSDAREGGHEYAEPVEAGRGAGVMNEAARKAIAGQRWVILKRKTPRPGDRVRAHAVELPSVGGGNGCAARSGTQEPCPPSQPPAPAYLGTDEPEAPSIEGLPVTVRCGRRAVVETVLGPIDPARKHLP